MVSHRFEVEGQPQQGRLAVAQSHELQSDRQPRGVWPAETVIAGRQA